MKFFCLYLAIFMVLHTVTSHVITKKKDAKKHEKRIVGGSLANVVDFKYQILMIGAKPNDTSASICGGSIITEKFVVTAGHCVVDQEKQYEVIAGISTINNLTNAQRSFVEKIVIHPEYNRGAQGILYNDIAVLKLKTPFVFNAYVGPVGLPDPQLDAQESTAQISGWGSINSNATALTPFLYYADVTVISNSVCEQAFKSFGADVALTERHICSRDSQPFRGICSGDSGGPLAQNGKLHGVISQSLATCDTEGGPSLYTRFNKFVPWVQTTIHNCN